MALILIGLPIVASAQETPPSAEDRLSEAESEYRQGQYRRTVALLKPLIYPRPTLQSVDDQHRSRELLGAAHWHLDEKDLAAREWERLLKWRPGLVLDEFTYPKPMRDFLERLRQELIAQEVIPKPDEAADPKPAPTVLRVTHYVEKRNRAIAFMPFGVPQFDQGEAGWGTFFATGQGISALGSVGSLVALTVMQWQNPTGFDPGSSQLDTANTLMLTTIVSGAVFYGLYAWGVIDANFRHEPSKLVRVENTYEDSRTVDGRPPQPVPAPSAVGAPSP
ncbi:MAG: hypothetical protein ACI9WU_003298 [Myxococcota bacterium]|jgi:hypothetical protein